MFTSSPSRRSPLRRPVLTTSDDSNNDLGDEIETTDEASDEQGVGANQSESEYNPGKNLF